MGVGFIGQGLVQGAAARLPMSSRLGALERLERIEQGVGAAGLIRVGHKRPPLTIDPSPATSHIIQQSDNSALRARDGADQAS